MNHILTFGLKASFETHLNSKSRKRLSVWRAHYRVELHCTVAVLSPGILQQMFHCSMLAVAIRWIGMRYIKERVRLVTYLSWVAFDDDVVPIVVVKSHLFRIDTSIQISSAKCNTQCHRTVNNGDGHMVISVTWGIVKNKWQSNLFENLERMMTDRHNSCACLRL